MSFKPNLNERYVDTDGRLTVEGLKLFQSITDRLDAIAAVSSPAADVTELKTAVDNIISGAS